MSYYHYTKGCHLPSIVKDGFIKTTNNGCEKREKPAAWLTKSPEWEVACNVGIVTNKEDLKSGQVYSSDEVDVVASTNDYMKKEIGMCRILISENLPIISWAKFKYVSGISEAYYYALDSFSRSKGCPVDKWICTFNPIPKKYWEGIEIYVADQWIRWDEKMPIKEFVDLCLSWNGKVIEKPKTKKGFPIEHALKQLDFINKYKQELVYTWETNKNRNGYIKIYIDPNYNPYKEGFQFIEKRFRKSSFKPLMQTESEKNVLVHFMWEATFTQYKVAIGY